MIRFEGDGIVLRSAPPPAGLRLLFAAVGVPFLGVGLVDLFNMANQLWWAPRDDLTAGDIALGVTITAGLLGIGGLLLYGALTPARHLRLDPRAAEAHLTVGRPFLTTRRRFAFASIAPPRTVFTPEDSETSASWSLVMRLPDGTTLDHCETPLSLVEQKDHAAFWSGRIAGMLAGADAPSEGASGDGGETPIR